MSELSFYRNRNTSMDTQFPGQYATKICTFINNAFDTTVNKGANPEAAYRLHNKDLWRREFKY